MPSKPLHLFSLFCSICKENIEIHAEDKKTAETKFAAFGHEYVKTNRLRRGVPGIYLNQTQVEKKYGVKESKERKKKRQQALREEVR